MLEHRFNPKCLFACTLIASLLGATRASAQTFPPIGGIFISDQELDQIYLSKDLNRDGDALDPGELSVYFDGTNASGFDNPTSNVFTIFQSQSGFQYFGDGSTDAVYRLRDVNRNGNALDAGEATLWFSATDNANGFVLNTPNGLAEDSSGSIYIVTAGAGSTTDANFVYRTQDLNSDGDANDLDEASIWLDLTSLDSNSSPFEIAFIDDVAFIADTADANPRVYRAEDRNNDNVIDPLTEVNIFIDESNPFGVGVFYFGLDTDSSSVLGLDLISNSIFRLTDIDNSGAIDQASEALEIWNPSVIPSGFGFGTGFSVASGPGGELSIISSSSDPTENNIFRLLDNNGDGDYLDQGETITYLSRALTSFFPDRPRALAYAQSVPEPNTVLALLGLTGSYFLIKRLKQL